MGSGDHGQFWSSAPIGSGPCLGACRGLFRSYIAAFGLVLSFAMLQDPRKHYLAWAMGRLSANLGAICKVCLLAQRLLMGVCSICFNYEFERQKPVSPLAMVKKDFQIPWYAETMGTNGRVRRSA